MSNAIKKLHNLEEIEHKMPVLFIGHGSPMNGIEENQYTAGWKKAIENVPLPKAIVVISAHWETDGTKVTAQKVPRTIYDFYGFPQALFEVQYPATGNPELAKDIAESVKDRLIELDENWGMDHGTWTVLRHLYPNAKIPVLQISLDRYQSPQEHFELAEELSFLRQKGVLIIASGNMIHNLRCLDFHQTGGHEWALETDELFKKKILAGEYDRLINYESLRNDIALSIPTPEHYLPLLYVLGLKKDSDPVEIFNDSIDLGSISMTSVKIG